jgi:hypothetical protein
LALGGQHQRGAQSIQLDAAPGISVQLKARLMFSNRGLGEYYQKDFERAARDFESRLVGDSEATYKIA